MPARQRMVFAPEKAVSLGVSRFTPDPVRDWFRKPHNTVGASDSTSSFCC